VIEFNLAYLHHIDGSAPWEDNIQWGTRSLTSRSATCLSPKHSHGCIDASSGDENKPK